jgi:hypothetical protein
VSGIPQRKCHTHNPTLIWGAFLHFNFQITSFIPSHYVSSSHKRAIAPATRPTIPPNPATKACAPADDTAGDLLVVTVALLPPAVELTGLLVVVGAEVVEAVTVVVFAALELVVRGADEEEVIRAEDAVVVAFAAAMEAE